MESWCSWTSTLRWARLGGTEGLAFASDDDECDASDDSDGTENRRDGDGARGFVADADRTDLGVLFFVGKADASNGESDDTENDEGEADDDH